jgi:hypothetical protein
MSESCRDSTAADPSGNGCASGTGAESHRNPCSVSRSRLKIGDTTPMGWIAAQTSW